MLTLALFVAVAIILSFLCSILEAVILSCTPSYVESLKEKSPQAYRRIQSLHSNIERPLAAILTVNTFAHTIGATGAGAQAQLVFDNKWITVFSIVLTLAILFLSEILPKSIGARYWKSLLSFSAWILPKLIIVSYPLVVISEWMSRFIKGKKVPKISREEVQAFTNIGLNDGTLSLMEHNIFKNIINFPQIKIQEVMTKAQMVVGFSEDSTTEEIFGDVEKTPYSRLLLFGNDQNEVSGYVLRDDILLVKALDKTIPLKNLMKPMMKVPSAQNLRAVFLRMLKRRQHIAAVLDDQNQFVGIISLEDLLENLLDYDIIDELDQLGEKWRET